MVRISGTDYPRDSTASMFATWGLRSNYESGNAISCRNSVPGLTKFLPFRRTTERKQRNVLRNEQHALRTMRTMQENNNQPKVNDDEHSSSREPIYATKVEFHDFFMPQRRIMMLFSRCRGPTRRSDADFS